MMNTTIILLIICAIIFDFLNGFHDSANIVATIISSKAMTPQKALICVAIAEFCGPFLFGVAVAETIGKEIVQPGLVEVPVIITALIGAILWNIFTWYLGIPSSSSHALIGGLIGSIGISVGFHAILLSGVLKIVLFLVLSPILGLLSGFLVTRFVFLLSRGATQKINSFFKGSQVLTGITMALSHGANDAQKTMGIITLGLVAGGRQNNFNVPLWVVLISAFAIALGTLFGGYRLIKTLGGKFFKIWPVHGFCTQITAIAVILGAALLGGPVSTTQVVSSTILGVGAADRINKVRWQVAKNIVMAWFVTIPFSAICSSIIYLCARNLF